MFCKILVLLLVVDIALAKTEFSITKNLDKRQSNIIPKHGLNIIKRECWNCTNPCSNTSCCTDGYEHCCVVGGHCSCCQATDMGKQLEETIGKVKDSEGKIDQGIDKAAELADQTVGQITEDP
ncbi:unnamed protein product [Cunninghamella echinulata]